MTPSLAAPVPPRHHPRHRLRRASSPALLAVLASMLGGCSSSPPLETVDHVDVQRFMGDWYVIANIPTFLEKGAHNAVETYALNDDGTIDTTFTFNKDSFDGPVKTMNPKGFVMDDPSNAVWGMRFVWPIKADYRIVYLSDDYERTIVGRNARDYVWIMARSPSISDAQYSEMKERVASMGYDMSELREVPQQPLSER